MGFCAIVLFVFIQQATILWFTRNTVFVAAPEATQIAVQLILNKKTWPVLQRALAQTPLISNRSLTVEDILPYTQGEMGWFFGQDGSRSIAIHTQPEKLPKELLDSEHIVVQQVSNHTFLLSEKLQPISGIKANGISSKWIPSLKTQIGEFYDREQNHRTSIYATKQGLSIDLDIKYPEKYTFDQKEIPTDASLVLSTPVLPSTLSHTQIDQFDQFVNPLIGHSLNDLVSSILSKKGILFTKNPSSFLLSSETSIKEADRIRFLQTAIVLKNPTIQAKTLPDKTSVQEFIADPTTVSIENRTVSGKEFFRAGNGSESLFLSKDRSFILSNNEEMLRDWLNKDQKKKSSLSCDADIAFVDMKNLFANDSFTKINNDADIFRLLFSKFHSISLKRNRNKVILNICY